MNIDSRHALLGYRSSDELWTVRVNYAESASSALNVDYGVKLTDTLAVGTNMTVGARRQDLVLNTFFVPGRNIRLHVAGGQLLQRDPYYFQSGQEIGQVQQSNFLVDLRKTWTSNAVIEGVAVTAYGANAHDRSSFLNSTDGSDERNLATGSLEGYRLNLTLAPTTLTRLELNHGVEQVSYHFSDGSKAQEMAESYEARYIRQLDRCAQLHGGFRTAASEDRLDVGIRQRAWNLGFSQTTRHDGNPGSTSVHVHYIVPLSDRRAAPLPCGGSISASTAQVRPLHHIAQRPGQLPSSALARIDPTASHPHVE